jgi:hypothetical protein
MESQLRDDFVRDPDLDIDERIPHSVNVKGHAVVPVVRSTAFRRQVGVQASTSPGAPGSLEIDVGAIALLTPPESRRAGMKPELQPFEALTFYVGQLRYRSVD